jgi:hypothetical protein
MSPVNEPQFFSRGGIPHCENVKDERAYLALFAPGSAATYRGEATAGYLWDENAAPANGLARFVPHRLKVPLGHAITVPKGKPPLEAETVSLLRDFYAEPDERLRTLLGRKLGWDS